MNYYYPMPPYYPYQNQGYPIPNPNTDTSSDESSYIENIFIEF